MIMRKLIIASAIITSKRKLLNKIERRLSSCNKQGSTIIQVCLRQETMKQGAEKTCLKRLKCLSSQRAIAVKKDKEET